MHQQSSIPSAFEQLENRTHFSVINVADKGPETERWWRRFRSIQAAINAARPGDTIAFNAGTFNINSQLLIRTGLDIDGEGVGGNGTTLQFSSPGDKFAAIIQQDAQNVSIHDFDIAPTAASSLPTATSAT